MFLDFLSHSIGLVVFGLRYRYCRKINPFSVDIKGNVLSFFSFVCDRKYFNSTLNFEIIDKMIKRKMQNHIYSEHLENQRWFAK